MKAKLNSFLLLALSSTAAHAAALTWDADTVTTAAQDGSGTWTTGSAGWWNGTANVNWTAGDTATFGAGADGTYAITLGGAITTGAGTQAAGALNFANSGYTLSAASPQQITTATGTSIITVAPGKTAVVGTNVTVKKGGTSNALNILGGGTLRIDTGGTLSNTFNNGNDIAGGTTLLINGGTATYGTSLVLGQLNAGDGLSGNLTVDSGSLAINANNLNVGRATGDISVATLNGGSITVFANVNFGVGGASPTGTFNLNGGTLTVKQVRDDGSTSTFNFNGGTLKAAASATVATFFNGIDTANVRNGGAKIDTNGQAVTIGQILAHSSIGVDDATDGGLTKEGSGSLTLTGANTYTGPTVINGGSIRILAPTAPAITPPTINNTGRLSVVTAATPASLSAVTVNTGGGFEANVGTYNPSSVSGLSIGTLNAAGNYKIDLSGSAIPVADITILTYASKTGTGTPSVGTLPFGCTATVEDTGSAIILHVLSPSATSFTWSKGTGDWDTSSLNWNANSVAYTEPALAILPIAGFGTVNITANRAPFSVDIASTTPNDYTFSGAGKITGTTGITKTGTGAVTFSNAANDYSGTTTISAGALVKATADTTIGAVAITDGATLGLSTGITTGTGQTITLAGPGVAANIVAAATATQRGSLQSVSGTNTWAGNIVLSGTAGAGGNTRIGVQNGATLTLTGNISEGVTGMSPLFRPGDGAGDSITINGTGSWTGTTRLFSNGGPVKLGGSDRFPTTVGLTIGTSAGATTLDLAGFNQTVAGFGGDPTGKIANTSGASTFTSIPAAAIGFPGVIQNNVSLVIGGTAIQTLSGDNTYSGNTTINSAGALTIAAAGELRFYPTTNGTTNAVGGSGALQFDGTLRTDLSGANSDAGNTWTLVNKSTLTSANFGTSFTVADASLGTFGETFLDSGIWKLTASGKTWTFTESDGKLAVADAATGFAAWADANAPGQTVDQDHDYDGMKNGIEYFMGESGTTFTPNPPVISNTVTWPMGATYSGTYGTDYVVQTSTNLDTWSPVTVGVGPGFAVINPGTSVIYTMPAPAGKLFVRLLVNPN